MLPEKWHLAARTCNWRVFMTVKENSSAFYAVLAAIFALSMTYVTGYAAEPAKPPFIRVAYFAPSDREPVPGYVERLERVMVEVQRFYREGMKAAGYGPMSYELERDKQNKLVVHVVRAPGKLRDYGRDSSGEVGRIVKESLKEKGLDPKLEMIVIFSNLLEWQGSKAEEIGPYCGGGGNLAGTAWIYDDKLLDPRELGSKKPGGYYGRPCSVGEFNSHYIGGAAHEMGHAFGLPHVCQTKVEKKARGNALMGGGNHSYGNELRGEGNGSFLHDNSALILSRNRYFAGDLPGADDNVKCEFAELGASFNNGKLLITGRITANPPAIGISVYDDWVKKSADYDAIGWLTKTDKDGRFRLEISELRRGRSEMKFRAVHVNGKVSTIRIDYEVDDKDIPDISAFNNHLLLAEAAAAFASKDSEKLNGIAAKTGKTISESQRKIAHLITLLKPQMLRSLSAVPDSEKSVLLSDINLDAEKVGWGRPIRNQVNEKENPWLQVGGKFYESGFYAHAPAKHEINLNRKWKRLQSEFGRQDGHGGSIVFVVIGDGRELFRSETVKDSIEYKLDIDVSSVNKLELVVEDAGDGTNSDWGVWLAPRLER